MSRRIVAFVVGAAIVAAIVALSSVFIVTQTEQALVLQFGRPVRVITRPGLEFKLPFVQNVVSFDKRLLDVEPPTEEVIAADQKRAIVDTYTRYLITNPLLFYQTVGSEEAVRTRLAVMVSSSMRQVIGKVPLSALLSDQRAPIMREIRDEVRAAAKPFGINVVDTRIRRVDLPAQNGEAIYARMNSERQQQAALYRGEGAQEAQTVRANADREVTVILADAQRDAQKLRGEGDAAATAIYAKAYGQDQEFFAFYRSLEAYRRAFAGHNTTFVLSPHGDFFRYFGNDKGGPAAPAAAAMPPSGQPIVPPARVPAPAAH